MDSFTVEAMAKAEQQDIAAQAANKERDKAAKNRARQVAKEIEADGKKAEKDAEKERKAQEEKTMREIWYRINARAENFKAVLADVPLPPKNASMATLEATEELQRQKLDMRGGPEKLMRYIHLAAPVIEGFVGDGSGLTFLPPAMRLNLKGMSDLLLTPEFKAELKPLIDETIIEHPWLARSSLTQRWLETFGTIFYTVHLLNTNAKVREAFEKRAKMLQMQAQAQAMAMAQAQAQAEQEVQEMEQPRPSSTASDVFSGNK